MLEIINLMYYILLPWSTIAISDYRDVICRQNVTARNMIISVVGSQRQATSSKRTCCAMGLERDSFSFFYNSLTNVCQLNQEVVDLSPGRNVINELGWELYILKDITCPAKYVHDLAVGICFRIYDPEPSFTIYSDFQTKCGNDDAVPFLVDTADKQNAIKNYINQRPGDFTTFILIQGHRVGSDFLDDNGNALVYKNWDFGQPGASELYIGIGKIYSYKWHDITGELSSSNFICEFKI